MVNGGLGDSPNAVVTLLFSPIAPRGTPLTVLDLVNHGLNALFTLLLHHVHWLTP
jgi:hypothetical protein